LVICFVLGMGCGVAKGQTPVFETGSSASDPYPYYQQSPFNTVPVGKTLVLPIVVSGSGPITYSVKSSSAVFLPVIKTGYPVMNIGVSYSGTTAVSGTVDTLYPFTGGTDGGNPYAAMTELDGSLYGTTESGSSGFGTAFVASTSGSLSTLHAFTDGTDGAKPYGGLVSGPADALYGTTETGGSNGQGTVYSLLSTGGSFNALYSFSGGPDGGNPYGSLATGTDGNLYGTTANGGSGYGTIFRITSTGTLTTIHTFTGGTDGAFPYSTLFTGTDGNFYGTTSGSGAGGAGTVFEINTSGSLNTLYPFTGGTDGGNPYAGVVQGSDGNFYGTTVAGGSNGEGTVYQLTSSGSLNTLHTFGALSSGTNGDGAKPYGLLATGSNGNLFGTTEAGGETGHGTVFQITTGGLFTSAYSFNGGGDGGNPYAGLVVATNGDLYGTTGTGGTNGYGTLYQVPVTVTPAFTGTMSFALLRDMAPITVGHIAGFAEAGYYDNTDFFRITNLAGSGQAPTFIAQGGDPTNTGTGSPGFAFNNEFNPSLIFTGQGQLAMANSGEDESTFLGTNGAQFFITQNPLRFLDFGYTVFGQELTGFDVMQKVMSVPLGSDGSSPTVPVVMNSVTVTEDNNNAVLLLSAAGSVPNGATINVSAANLSGDNAVVITGSTSTTGLTLDIATYDDTVNDPPFIVPDQDVSMPLHEKVSVPMRGVDLEYDYLNTAAQAISNPVGAELKQSGNIEIVTPNPAAPISEVDLGLLVYQPFTSTERSSEFDLTAVNIGLGTGKLTPMPLTFEGSPQGQLQYVNGGGTGMANLFGEFLCSNLLTTGSAFSATVNWGDGSTISGTSAVSVIKSSYLPTTYYVQDSAGHGYSNAGIYPINVEVTNTNGATVSLNYTAVVGSGPIYGFGEGFTAAKGEVKGPIASFSDRSPNVVASDYEAVIDWGDGSVTTVSGSDPTSPLGNIRGTNGQYLVYGAHKYSYGNSYPVDVTIKSVINSNTSYAWSTAYLTGVATRQPPFAQSHIVAQLGNPGYGNGYIDEEVTLFNSGNIASGPISLKFYLSPTSATDPISSGAIPLEIGKSSTYNTTSIPANSPISGSVSDIIIPAGTVTHNKFLIMQVITSDPIGSHEDYPRYFADPTQLLE
jgi:uncharacterized repeat protein (TIGR03803 family)